MVWKCIVYQNIRGYYDVFDILYSAVANFMYQCFCVNDVHEHATLIFFFVVV